MSELTPELERDPVVVNLRADGLEGYVALAVKVDGKHYTAALTLMSKSIGRYGKAERDKLRELGVEQALLVADAKLVSRREVNERDLRRKLRDAPDYRSLAREFNGVAKCFQWDYVAVFGVDRQAGLFRLVEQGDRTGNFGRDLPANYTEPLSKELRGEALRDNCMRQEPDIQSGTRCGYTPVVAGRRSAMAVPIHVPRQEGGPPLSDQVEWVLSVEASRTNAFQGPDVVSFKAVLVQCEDILRQRWQKAVQTSLLEAAEQAIVVVDSTGKMRLTNRRAERLLCHSATE